LPGTKGEPEKLPDMSENRVFPALMIVEELRANDFTYKQRVVQGAQVICG